ncbi:hypothetical protein BaRGS_00024024 [Batillaria attramentaria]|uniref:Uncharacterized protein n=1 Tax=Batillaria attramentaria TaxID=370345 RepID=A0ABD0KCE5_9CAEN
MRGISHCKDTMEELKAYSQQACLMHSFLLLGGTVTTLRILLCVANTMRPSSYGDHLRDNTYSKHRKMRNISVTSLRSAPLFSSSGVV